MKKAISMSLLVLGVLMAIPMAANAQAIVIRDTDCTAIGYDLNPIDLPNNIKIATPSRNYNKNVSCHGDLPVDIDPPANAVVLNYDNTTLACCVNFSGIWYSTNQWHETITPSGNVSLTCHFKGNEPAGECGGVVPE